MSKGCGGSALDVECAHAGVDGAAAQVLLNAEQLVVLGHPLGAAGGAGLDLAGVQRHGQIGKREGAGLLTAVLAIVAIGLPAVYFGTFFANLSKQIKKLGLPRPFYRLELDAAGLSVWMAGEQNKTEPTNRYTWNTVYCAYRTKEAVYIYVQKNQAYLLNESMDAAWSLLGSALPAASLHDCRK